MYARLTTRMGHAQKTHSEENLEGNLFLTLENDQIQLFSA